MLMVTPCVGVWIETGSLVEFMELGIVTPCVGVWIETQDSQHQAYPIWVTPCVGVWIETESLVQEAKSKHSHTLRGCVD